MFPYQKVSKCPNSAPKTVGVSKLHLQKYAIEIIKTRVSGGLYVFSSNPTTSTENRNRHCSAAVFAFYIPNRIPTIVCEPSPKVQVIMFGGKWSLKLHHESITASPKNKAT
jgi:hypothetical protein